VGEMELEDIFIYNFAMEIGEIVWNSLDNWDYFSKSTLGKQLIRAVDSIAANISEGHGRFHFKENRQFLYYARGSLAETKTWLLKAKNRSLINQSNYNNLFRKIETLRIKLNSYIQSIGRNPS